MLLLLLLLLIRHHCVALRRRQDPRRCRCCCAHEALGAGAVHKHRQRRSMGLSILTVDQLARVRHCQVRQGGWQLKF